MSDVELEEADHMADRPSEREKVDDRAADLASELAGDSASVESASVEVLSAEVRVLQVGNGQITRSMYRQLDEAAPGQFQPFGRVKDNERTPKELWVVKPREEALQLVGRDTKTGALVRCDAYPVRQLDRPRQLETRQQRCKVDLDELQRQWREKADNQLAEILKAQTKYDKFKALPLIVLPD